MSLRQKIAIAIARHDHDRIPENYGSEIDHAEVSDWSVYLADKVLAALGESHVVVLGREETLKMMAGLFADSVHETYTREEVVSIIEDAIKLGRPTVPSPDREGVVHDR